METLQRFKSLVSWGNGFGVETWQWKFRSFRLVVKRMHFSDHGSSTKVDLFRVKEDMPDKYEGMPGDMPVCPEGCGTFMAFYEDEPILPCGKCGAMMKPKKEAYPEEVK